MSGRPEMNHLIDARLDDRALFRAATTPDALDAAWARVRANAGAAGGDGMMISSFARDVDRRLAALSGGLRSGSYLPASVREVDIPKSSGGTRRLTIPSITDRVAQTAVAQTLGPPLDAEFEDASFGYRPGRSVKDAVRRISALQGAGAAWVVDADIEDFFDSVPHDRLLERLGESMTEGPLTELIALWLEHFGRRGRGLAQGSPLSPLLANLYLDRLDEAFAGKGARIVRYADDFVILCRSSERADDALAKARTLLREHGLTLNEDKTRVVSFQRGFRFLGHLFVRSLALPSPRQDEEDRVNSLLRRLANDDARQTAETAVREREADAGYLRRRRTLHLLAPGRRLSVRNRAFAVEEAEGGPDDAVEWRELLAIPHGLVDRIEIGRGAAMTREAVQLGLDTGTLVAHVDGRGRTLGWTAPALAPRATRQLAQARLALDPDARLALAKILVDGRLRNQRALLRRLNYRRKNAEIAKSLAEINRLIRRLKAAEDIPNLMGWEGRAAALYWPAFSQALPAHARFHRRIRPSDGRGEDGGIANAVLNLAAGLLARDVSAAIWRAGLHPGFGVLHATNDSRDAAVFDLIEEFRAPLAESTAAYALNNRIIGPAADGGRLKREDVAAFIRVYEQAIGRAVRYPPTGDRRIWREIVGEQAVLLAAHMEGRAAYGPVVMDY